MKATQADIERLLDAEQPESAGGDFCERLMTHFEKYGVMVEQENQRAQQAGEAAQRLEESRQRMGERYDSETAQAAIELLDQMAQAQACGEITDQVAQSLMRSINYERDTAQAEIRGRNAAIEIKMRQRDATDGVPHMGSADAHSPYRGSIFDIAAQA